MRSTLKTSVLALMMLGSLGGGLAMAQTAPETPAQSQPAPVAIPELLQGSAFTDVESRPGPRGLMAVQGRIAETGKDFDALVNGEGQLVGIRTAEGSALPQTVRDALLPKAARSNPVLSEIAVMNAIGTRGGKVMASGQDASGDKVRAGFDAAGELVLFTRGERGEAWMSGREGKGHRGEMRHRGERGERGEHGRHGGMRHDGERGHHGEMKGEGRHGDKGPRDGAPVDETALRSAVEGAGYTDLGQIRPTRRGIAIEAVNPQGENVTVMVNPEGEVMRETAR